ncbi:hypothetical protein C0J52_02587, partial [Blattella germanica]
QFPTPSLRVINVNTRHTIILSSRNSIIAALLVVSVKMSTRGMRLRSFTCSEKLKKLLKMLRNMVTMLLLASLMSLFFFFKMQ